MPVHVQPNAHQSHVSGEHTDIQTRTHIFALQCQCVCPKVTQATRRHHLLLWHMWHTRPARVKPNGLAAPAHPQSSKTLTPKAFQLWDTWSPELTSQGVEGHITTPKHPHPPPNSTQNMQECDGQRFGNTRAHQSSITSHFYLSRQTETCKHFAPSHFQASLSSAPINARFSVVPPSLTTLQMHSLQKRKKK